MSVLPSKRKTCRANFPATCNLYLFKHGLLGLCGFGDLDGLLPPIFVRLPGTRDRMHHVARSHCIESVPPKPRSVEGELEGRAELLHLNSRQPESRMNFHDLGLLRDPSSWGLGVLMDRERLPPDFCMRSLYLLNKTCAHEHAGTGTRRTEHDARH